MAGPFITDGMTLSHTIAEKGSLAALVVDYRPAMPARVYRWKRAAAKINADDKMSVDKQAEADLDNDASLLADQLVSWNSHQPLTKGQIKALPYPYLQDLLNVVLGYVTPNRGTGESEKDQQEGN